MTCYLSAGLNLLLFFILHYLIIHSTYYTNSIPHEAYVSVEKGKKERMNMEISKLYN